MSETQQTTLKKQLSSRHITMLALGGAIGAGLFKGSGEAIGIAGPSVLIAFLIGGAVLFLSLIHILNITVLALKKRRDTQHKVLAQYCVRLSHVNIGFPLKYH